jgi:hypothetical protein
MTSITLSVPEDVRILMKKFPEVNWSALVRQCIIQKTKQLSVKEEFMNQLKKEKEFDDWAVDLIRKGRK